MRKFFLVATIFLWATSSFAEPPTRDYTTVTKIATATGGVFEDSTLWDPDSGKRIVLLGVFVSSDVWADIELEVSNVDAVNPIHLESPGSKLIESGGRPIWVSAKDAVLTWSSKTLPIQANVSIMVWGYEEQVG